MYDCLIDPYLPASELHLLASPPGDAGTTLLFQLIDQYREALAPFWYLSDENHDALFERLDIQPWPIIQLARDPSSAKKWHSYFSWLDKKVRSAKVKPRLIICDGGLSWFPGISGSHGNRPRLLAAWADFHDITLILTCDTNKRRGGPAIYKIKGAADLPRRFSTKAILTQPNGKWCLDLIGCHFRDEKLCLERHESGAFTRIAGAPEEAQHG